MSSTEMATEPTDKKAVLSTMWIFVTLNYLFCDVFSNMDPVVVKELLTGMLGGLRITQGFLLQAAVLMEIPIAMVLLCRILPYKLNRWITIIAASILIAVQGVTMFVGTPPTIHYIFYSVIEIATLFVIAGYAWRWKISRRMQGI